MGRGTEADMLNRTQNRQSRCKKRRGLRCGCGACPADEHKDAAAEQHSCERCGDTLAPLACRQRQLVRLAAVLVPEQNTRPRHESAAHDGDERGHDLRWHQGLCSVHRQGSPQRSSGKGFRGDGTCAATEVGLAPLSSPFTMTRAAKIVITGEVPRSVIACFDHTWARAWSRAQVTRR